MTKILFVCHGNICRSPMAEFIMKDIIKKKGLEDEFYIKSAATSREELGNSVYPPAKRILNEMGIDCRGKIATQVTRDDYQRYDYLICMDRNNIRNLRFIIGDDKEEKVSLLLDYTNEPRDVADPWYTDDFEATKTDVINGCTSLLDFILNNK